MRLPITPHARKVLHVVGVEPTSPDQRLPGHDGRTPRDDEVTRRSVAPANEPLERRAGIAPAFRDWRSRVLLLDDRRKLRGNRRARSSNDAMRSHPLAPGLVPTDDSVSNLLGHGAIGGIRTHTLSTEPQFLRLGCLPVPSRWHTRGRRRSRSPNPEVRIAFEAGLVPDQFVFRSRTVRSPRIALGKPCFVTQVCSLAHSLRVVPPGVEPGQAVYRTAQVDRTIRHRYEARESNPAWLRVGELPSPAGSPRVRGPGFAPGSRVSKTRVLLLDDPRLGRDARN